MSSNGIPGGDMNGGMGGGRWRGWVIGVVVVLALLAPVGLAALRLWADLTVNQLFFNSLGMGSAHATIIRSYLVLLVLGLASAVVVGAPLVVVGRRVAGTRGPRAHAWVAAGAVMLLSALIIVPTLTGQRDELLAAVNAVPFGVNDPVFGHDVGFYVFVAPVVGTLIGALISCLVVATIASAALMVIGLRARRGSRIIPGIAGIGPLRVTVLATRGLTLLLVYGGLTLFTIGAAVWWARYGALTGDDELIAGAGEARRAVGIPTQSVVAVVAMLVGLGVALLAVPAVHRRLVMVTGVGWLRVMLVVWSVATLALAALATPWWLVLVVPIAVFAGLLRARARVVAVNPVIGGLIGRPAPIWLPIALGALTTIVGLAFAPLGTALYDNVALRGSTLQVEGRQIAATLTATRAAAGIDGLTTTDARYRRGGVTREGVARAAASVASLRFLDYGPALNACRRLQALNRYYTCQDADLDRYTRADERQTMFVFGREVDYDAIPDFQRRHFAFTHGNGIVMAPVNRIDSSGRPDFVVFGLPVQGLTPPLTSPQIYFGAQENMPWAIVNTDQPDGFTGQPITNWRGAGVPVEGHRLAITLSLGGLPYVGGGRRLWNTLDRVQGADSRLLMYRDITARMKRLTPFLVPDEDPYFVVADGRMWVMLNGYSMTDRYPYSARYGGRNYQRHAVTAVMDAASGQTRLYVMDDEDPIVRTWRRVYPALFTDRAQMPAALAAHLRYGEDLFAYQAAVLGRFHVTDPDAFFNNDDAWAPTVETVGPGAEGTRILSPARYTYARLPGAPDERFVLVRYFKPAVAGRGIGFSAWLAVDNDPERFGDLSVVRFTPDGPSPLDSVDTFASNVGRDPELSAQIGVRTDQILRGNVIVVPIGEGLLYVQPLYLDTSADSLPTLWQVVVSFGDGRISYAPTFRDALARALAGQVAPDVNPDDLPNDLRAVVDAAAGAYDAYRQAWAAGRYEQAARDLARFERLLTRARNLANG